MIPICILIFLTTLYLVSFAIRKIIYVSHKKHLFDEPSENRKIHKTNTPNLGGVAIFAIMLFASSIFLPYAGIPHINYILASAVILFTLGLTDDLVGVNPLKKMFAQLLAALIITIPAGFRFTDEEAKQYGFKQIEVRVVTLNGFIPEINLPVPDIIKIDAEGLDLEVLKGASDFFGKTEVFMVEAGVGAKGIPNSFLEVINFMNENGYQLFEITDMNRPFDLKILWLVELVFVRKNGLLDSQKLVSVEELK